MHIPKDSNSSNQEFSDLVKDLVVNPSFVEQVLHDVPVADRSFIVLFTPRSGSSWLTKIVSATKCLGNLEEYLNPDFVRDVAKKMEANDPKTLLAMLKRCAKTDNGIFSMEVRAVDVRLFSEAEFFDSFGPETIIFFLWRDNIVAQGISLFRAVTTKRYHSTDAPVAVPIYDVEEIARWMRHIATIENENMALLTKCGWSARFLRYEDIVRDKATTLAMLAEPMRVHLVAEQLEASRLQELRKISDEWNRNAEHRFRQERRDFIWELEEQRLIRGF